MSAKQQDSVNNNLDRHLYSTAPLPDVRSFVRSFAEEITVKQRAKVETNQIDFFETSSRNRFCHVMRKACRIARKSFRQKVNNASNRHQRTNEPVPRSNMNVRTLRSQGIGEHLCTGRQTAACCETCPPWRRQRQTRRLFGCKVNNKQQQQATNKRE